MACRVIKFFEGWWRRFLAFLIPILLLPLLFSVQTQAAKCAYVIILAVSYWIIEPVGVPATAMIPIFLFPLLGIMSMADTCQHFIKEPVVMYMGCFAVGVAMEHCGLHRRIALKSLLVIGTSVRRLTFGCMVLTTFVSMWLNNAASAMCMMPIVETVLKELNFDAKETEANFQDTNVLLQVNEKPPKKCDLVVTIENGQEVALVNGRKARRKAAKVKRGRIREAFLLSITYGASFGGIATLNGSGPNYVFKGVLDELYPNHEEPTYITWMLCHVPTMLLCTLCACFFLQVVYLGLGFLKSEEIVIEHVIKTALVKKYEQLGRFKFQEGAVLLLSTLLFGAWFFRDPKFMEGWAKELFGGIQIDDATPAIGVTLLLFLLPSNPGRFWSSPPLLDWKTFQLKMPWGILLLVGSGFIIAEGSKRSGFSLWVSQWIMSISHLSTGTTVFVIVLLSAGLTEFLNNSATTSMLLPVLSRLAEEKGVNPLMFLVPVTVASSFAFMFPVSQPSNAIVFQRGKLRTPQMMIPGIVMNILCCCIEVLMINTLGVFLFDLNTYPHWLSRSHLSSSSAPYWQKNVTDYYLLSNGSYLEDLWRE